MGQYLVTGGCGFIGSHLAEALINAGHNVRILDDLSTGKRENAPLAAELVVGSITDLRAVANTCDDIDGCFHLAAIASVEECRRNPEKSRAVNYTGTARFIGLSAAAKKPFPIVYASSAAVYGNPAELPLKETSPTQPLSQYGQDKLGCEEHAARNPRAPALGFRFFNVYGPRQDPSSPYSGVISIFADRIARKQPITFYGDGSQTRDFIYVGDVVEAMMRGMDTLRNLGKSLASPVLNVCTGQPTTLLELADTLEAIAGNRVERSFAPAREGDIHTSLGSNAALRNVLGFTPKTALKDGLPSLFA